MDPSTLLKEVKRNISLLLISVFSLGFAAPASATLVTIEPDDFAAGQYISFATAGAQLSAMTMTPAGLNSLGNRIEAPVYGPVFAYELPSGCVLDNFPCAYTGNKLFGRAGTGSHQYRWGEAEVGEECLDGCNEGAADTLYGMLRVDFTTPTDYVDVMATIWAFDSSWLQAFDSNGNSILACYGYPSWVTGPTADGHVCNITPEILAGGGTRGWFRYSISAPTADISFVLIGGYGNVREIDVLRFNSTSVTEPEALGLFALGLIGFALTRRRRWQQSEAVL